MPEKCVTIKEAARLIGCTKNYLRFCICNKYGKLKTIPKEPVRITLDSVLAFKSRYKPRRKNI